METFISFILGFIIFIYLFGIVSKWLLKYWIKRKMRQMQNGQGGGFSFNGNWGNRQQSSNEQQRAKGDIKISNLNSEKRRINSDVGEYVDFEDVK